MRSRSTGSGRGSCPSSATRPTSPETAFSSRDPWTVVLDWDGTVTEIDTLHLILERFGDVEIYRRVEDDLGRALTLHEVIAVEFETVRAPLEKVVAFVVETARVRPGFRELVDAFRPTVISSGFHELIRPVLAREGVAVEVLANTVEARPDGWRVRFRDEAACATCGEACKRASLPMDAAVVYVGDGYSDRCAALAADRVFATAGLARYLQSRGVPYEPFETLEDVHAALSR
jgi:2-hydroxy-3-keto-5-methylthiopentenyl-1-phosphate phosphatase